MSHGLKLVIMACLLVGLSMGAMCAPVGDQQPVDTEAKISEGRMNAARVLDNSGAIFVDVRQHTMDPGGQMPGDPFGVAGGTPWPSRINGPVALPLAALTADPHPLNEYDRLSISQSGETARVLSIRVPTTSVGDQEGTVVEFNFRAINPFAHGHDPASGNYTLPEARYPSNDRDLASRSLVDPNMGSVAVVVRGVPFKNATATHTAAIMPTADTAWLGFMRDDGLNSGRFYWLNAARSGGPVALADILGMEGDYQSVQINGSDFGPDCDWSTTYVNGWPIFPGYKSYAFADFSNLDHAGQVVGGLGGFVFILRPNAFAGRPVVIDPAQPIMAPGNLAAPPNSGYDEIALGAFTGDTTFHTPVRQANGPPGVHELSVAVYFWHGGEEEPE
jgi:hypothetical protein